MREQLFYRKFSALLRESFGAAVCRETDHFHPLWDVACDFESTFTDRSGGAENDEFLRRRGIGHRKLGNYQQIHVQNRRGEKHGIDQIKHATDAGHFVAGIFGFETAFQNGFSQIPENRNECEGYTQGSMRGAA